MISASSSSIQILEHVQGLAQRFDAVLCDVWGVVHNGERSIQSACDALFKLREQGKTVLLLSNAPRPGIDVIPQITAWGVPENAYDGIVTSGDGTRALLQESAGACVFPLGPERDLPLYAELDLSLGGIENADLVVCTGLYNDDSETPDDYRDQLAEIYARKLPMICANPDIFVERGDRLVYCAGAIAGAYGDLGGHVIYVGKPFAPIYDLAIARLAKIRGERVTRDKLLCIGDGIKTDMEGAFRAGIDALFVASGLHIQGFDESVLLSSEVIEPLFCKSRGRPVAAQTRLTW